MSVFTDDANLPKLLFVGAFPPEGSRIFGGNVTACKTLLDAGLADQLALILLDSTMKSVPPPPVLRRLVYAVRRICRFVYLVEINRPDAILIFASTGASFIEKSFLAALSRIFRIRIMFFPRGGLLMDECRRSAVYRGYVRLMMRFPDILLCQGEAWRDFFARDLGLAPDKCVLFSNWTATPPLLEIGARRHYAIKEKVQILFLGWIKRSKGVFELIDAVSQLSTRFPGLQLLIAGEGKDLDEAYTYVAQKGIEANACFAGWIEGECKLSILSDADIFCLPSHAEGFPNAMIEAMAVGLPVVVTPVGSIPDVIVDGDNGLIAPVKNATALAQCIETLILNPYLREKLGRAAHTTAIAKFSAVRAVRQLTSLVAR